MGLIRRRFREDELGEMEFLGYVRKRDLPPGLRGGVFGKFRTPKGIRVLGSVTPDMLRRYGDSDLQSSEYSIGEGDAAIRKTLACMKKLALKGAHDKDVWEASRRAVAGRNIRNHCEVRDTHCEMGRLLEWVQNNIRWTPDIGTAETVAAPWRTLGVGAADCDCLSTLLASMAISIGIPVRFKAIGASEKHPDEFTHVYVEMRDHEGDWIPAEPSIKDAPLGWESPVIMREMIYPVWNGEDA